MMRIYITILGVLFWALPLMAQVGINTEDYHAVLDVKTVGDSVPLKIDDKSGNELMRIDRNSNIGIGSSNPQRSIHVKAPKVRFEGTHDMSHNASYNKILVINADGDVDVVPTGLFVMDLPTVKALRYASHTFEFSDSQDKNIVEKNSTIEFGDIRIRYTPTAKENIYSYGWGYIQIQMVKDNFYAVYWEKDGGGYPSKVGSVGYNTNGQVSNYFNGVSKGYTIDDHVTGWTNFKTVATKNSNMENPNFVDMNYVPELSDTVTSLIVLNNTQKFYRLNFVSMYSSQSKSGTMTIFIEALE